MNENKLYAVVHEQEDYCGDRESKIQKLFRTEYQARKFMLKLRDKVLANEYNVTPDEMRLNDSYDYKESKHDVYMQNKDAGCWDDIRIESVPIYKNKYIDVVFLYDGKTYFQRIYIADIDMEHYEKVWSEVFGEFNDGANNHDDQLVFELVADKYTDVTISLNNMYIDVYENDEADDPFDRITSDIYVRTSWSGRNWFELMPEYK